MNQKLIYGIILLVSLIFWSCASKVNKEELDKKIENMDPDNISFSNDEYEFMTAHLIKHFDDDSADNEEFTDEDAQQFVYFVLLSEADEKGKLKGKTKEQFEIFKKKVNETVETAQKEAMESIEQAMRASGEVNEEEYSYGDTEGDPSIGY